MIALCSAVPASADVRRAESILPPGQSGFVAPAEVLDGTGSPHLTDQLPLFNRFEYKSALFNRPGRTETPRPGVKITRDSFGVPRIDATSDYDAWWGVGYAVAQDRLFQLEAFRAATSGRLAELIGPAALEADVVARRDYYTDRELVEQLDRVPANLRNRFDAYRDGINAWRSAVLGGRLGDLPGEFIALATVPRPWTVLDSARVGVFLARTVPSGDGEELNNAAALEQAGPDAFDALLPLRTPGQRPTIPKSEGEFPSQPGRTRADEQDAFRRSREFLRGLDLPGRVEDNVGTVGSAGASGPEPLFDAGQLGNARGSFMWGIRSPRGERPASYLFNGPQLGFSAPELFVEFELHSPTQDIRGVSAAGVPVMGIGHNDRLAWGFTSGLSDEDDLYAEQLTGPESYRFRGEERQMSCRNERFLARTPVTSLPDLPSDPQLPIQARTVRICRTVHGPVQERVGDTAFARRYAIWGKEIQTLIGLSALNDAKTVEQADRALRKVTWNENVIAADDRGSIGYWHPGLHPLRPKRFDERLPYPGTGEAEWRGFLSKDERPHVINPKRGWLTQWNNIPSTGWTSGDGPARERLTGGFHRVRLLERLVADVARDPSYKRSRDIIRRSGTTAQQFPFADPLLRSARREADGRTRAVLGELKRWNGSYASTDSAGTVAPGAAIWEALKEQAAAIALDRLGPGAELLDGGASINHQFDIRNAEAFALRTLSPKRIAVAARRARTGLSERFEDSDPKAWREPRRIYDVAAQGAAQVPTLPFFDRGTWEQSVELGR